MPPKTKLADALRVNTALRTLRWAHRDVRTAPTAETAGASSSFCILPRCRLLLSYFLVPFE